MTRYGCGLCGRYGWDPAFEDGRPICYDCGNEVILNKTPQQILAADPPMPEKYWGKSEEQ